MYAVGTAGLDLQRLSCEVAAFQNQPKEVGILYSNTSRMYDIGHLNIKGAIKTTKYLGEYMNQNFKINNSLGSTHYNY